MSLRYLLVTGSLLVASPLEPQLLRADGASPSSTDAPEPCRRLSWETALVESEPGVSLFVRKGGSGSAVLVPGDFLLFEHLCALATDHTVVFYDMRNRGRSSRVEDGDLLTLEADVRDLEAVRRRHALPEAALVGYSYLGKLAILYTLEHPYRVRRIVQLGPVPMDAARTFPPELEARQAPPEELVAELRAARAGGLHETDPAEYCRREWAVTAPLLVGDPARAARLRDSCELPNEWPVNLVFHMEHHFQRSALRKVVTATAAARVEVPVLTVHGTLDRNAPYGGGREWAASLPEGRLLTVEGAAHASFAEVDLLPALRTFLAGEWPATAQPISPAADGERSRLQAWDLLRRALDLHGGSELPPGRALALELAGELYPRSQGRTPEPPYDPFPVRQELLFDIAGERLERIQELQWPNFVSRERTVIGSESSFEQDLETGAIGPPWQEPAETLRDAVRRLPPLLLREILEEGAASLRFAGLRPAPGSSLQVVEAIHRGEHVDLLLAEDGRLAGLGWTADEPMLGDVYQILRFEGRVEAGRWALPRIARRELEVTGVASRLELRAASWEGVDEARFAPPRDVAPQTSAQNAAEASSPSAGALELAAGIALVWTAAHADYRSLVVERADHLVLVEAPQDEATSASLLGLLARRHPGKPVRWLVATHHHFDHSGGVPAALAATGATLVTTPGNKAFFQRAVTGPRTLREGAMGGATPKVLTIDERHILPGDGPEVVVLPLGPTDHVAEVLGVYLPESRILFQGDFARFPLEDGDLYRPDAAVLSRRIRELGLDVDRIAGVHGDVGTPADLPGD